MGKESSVGQIFQQQMPNISNKALFSAKFTIDMMKYRSYKLMIHFICEKKYLLKLVNLVKLLIVAIIVISAIAVVWCWAV